MLEQENLIQALKLLEMVYGNQVTEEKIGRMFLVENQKQKKSIEVLVTMSSLPIMKI